MGEKKRQQCARCGSCTAVCPVYKVTGRESLTARGKLHLLTTPLAEVLSRNYQDLFSQCLLCGACEEVCPRDLPVCGIVAEARSGFDLFYGRHGVQKTAARMVLARPGLLEGLVKAGVSLKKLSVLPEDSGLRLKLGLLESSSTVSPSRPSAASPLPPQGSREAAAYFAGCLARYLQPSVARSTEQLFAAVSGDRLFVPGTQVCCGLAAWSSGNMDEARELARKNITAFAETTGPILTSCASCSSFLKSYPALFEDEPQWLEKARQFCGRVREFASFFLEKMAGRKVASPSPVKLFYHEPCHLRFDAQDRNGPHELIGRIANITRVAAEDGPLCCGQGGLFHLGYPELSAKIFSQAFSASKSVDPEVVVTTCSGCLMQWQAGLAERKSDVRAVHLAVFLARCLDIDA